MRRKGSAIVACAALLLLGVGTAGAWATSKVELKANGELLPVGAPLLLSSANLEIHFNNKTHTVLSCTKTAIDGSVVLNAKAKATATISEAAFSGGYLPEESRCGGGFHTTGVFLKGFNVNPIGTAELKEAELELEPLPGHKADEGRCKLKLAALKGTFPLTSSEAGEPLTITLAGSRMRVLANSGKECGTEGTLTMTLETSSAGSPVFVAVIP